MMSKRAKGRMSAGKPGELSRVSISLPSEMLRDLDQMVDARGFDTRSQAINDMLHQSIVGHRHERGDDVMVGIIALFYKNSVKGLQKTLADLQVRYIDEVISSLHVHLMNNHTMEVVLVQGPARNLQTIADHMTSRKGVVSGKIHLVAALIPQLHPFTDEVRQIAKQAKNQGQGSVS
jgi:CopG family nickel-responsive transcriptional regulator